MKLKINKASDLSSISALPPNSRRSSVVSSGLETSLAFPRNQTTSQVLPQQLQHLQPALSEGVPSHHGLMSQYSQNSQDDNLTNEAKVGSQERENSVRTSWLPPISGTREESQLMLSRTSNNVMRRWSSQEYKCQISVDLEHRIGMIETSLSRLGMTLDAVQSDIMQANKSTKEVALEMEGVRQKLISHDDSLESLSRGQEDIKACMNRGFNFLADQLKQSHRENLGEIITKLSTITEIFDNKIVKLLNDIYKDFHKEIQAISCSMDIFKQKQQEITQIQGPKVASFHASPLEIPFPNNGRRHSNANKTCVLPKINTGGWTSVKQEQATYKSGNFNKRTNRIMESPNRYLDCRVVPESDEEIDGGLSCLLKEKGTEIAENFIEEETAQILRKARRRKRKYCNTIIIN